MVDGELELQLVSRKKSFNLVAPLRPPKLNSGSVDNAGRSLKNSLNPELNIIGLKGVAGFRVFSCCLSQIQLPTLI